MSTNLKARIVTDVTGPYFDVKRGVRQGDPLSSALFNCLFEEVFTKLNWTGKGVNINGEYINNLRFADDIIVIAKNPNELKEMVEELTEKGKKSRTQPIPLKNNTDYK